MDCLAVEVFSDVGKCRAQVCDQNTTDCAAAWSKVFGLRLRWRRADFVNRVRDHFHRDATEVLLFHFTITPQADRSNPLIDLACDVTEHPVRPVLVEAILGVELVDVLPRRSRHVKSDCGFKPIGRLRRDCSGWVRNSQRHQLSAANTWYMSPNYPRNKKRPPQLLGRPFLFAVCGRDRWLSTRSIPGEPR